MGLTRSEQMARIINRNTRPELLLRRSLWSRGARYRLSARSPAGRPDLVFPGRRLAVFVDGCFWHGCPLHYARPRSSEAFWSSKLIENVVRDARQTEALKCAGWSVVRLWEHEILVDLTESVRRVELALQGHGEEPLKQHRVVRVIDIGDGEERRELVSLRNPTIVIDSETGKRVTNKARAVSSVNRAKQPARSSKNPSRKDKKMGDER